KPVAGVVGPRDLAGVDRRMVAGRMAARRRSRRQSGGRPPEVSRPVVTHQGGACFRLRRSAQLLVPVVLIGAIDHNGTAGRAVAVAASQERRLAVWVTGDVSEGTRRMGYLGRKIGGGLVPGHVGGSGL